MGSPSAVFDYPSVRELSEFLVREVAPDGGGDAGGGDEWEEYEDWEEVEEAVDGEYEEIMPVQSKSTQPSAGAASAVAATSKKAGLDLAMVTPKVTELVKAVLTDDDDVAADTPFMEAGIDSLGSVQLLTDVSKTFNMNLSPSAVFDYPTIRALADFLVAESNG